MPRSHECLGRCGRRVGRSHACPSCWARLPERLREAVASARHKSRAYSAAVHNVHLWFTENPLESPLEGPAADVGRRAES
jgi:hypothetical protein